MPHRGPKLNISWVFKTNEFFFSVSIMFVAMLLLIVFKIIVFLKINIHKTSLKEKKKKNKSNLSSNILSSPACVSLNYFVLVAFVLNISALFCSLLNLFFPESVNFFATGGPTFGIDAMVFWACVQCQKEEQAIFWCWANR